MFEYRCDRCGEQFEKLVRSLSTQQPVACPACGSTETRKQFSTFASVGTRSGTTTASSCAPGGG